MSDETNNNPQDWASEPAAGPEPAAAPERIGFCQDCGKPLTAQTIRPVGAGVFCEPCLAARVATASPYVAAAAGGAPSPKLAALLGFIPGVGAMYNGQYAKGIAHLIVFAVLTSLSDHVSDLFGFFCFAWFCYMIFDAYHTAKARLEGMPLPNPFGLNDIGERFGFGKGWPTTPPTWAAPGTPPSPPAAATPPVSGAGPVGASAPASGWVGYVPPTEFGAAAAYRPAPPPAAAYTAPYAETYTSPAMPPMPYSVDVSPVAAGTAQKRFPVGAFWLIGLGVLILIANLVPDWRVTDRWWLPVLFAGLSIWLFTRRLRTRARLVCIIRWPVILMVLAILLALQAAYFAITFGLVCSVMLITIGLLLLLERTLGAGPGDGAAAPAAGDPLRASFTTARPATPPEPVQAPMEISTDDTTKGGL